MKEKVFYKCVSNTNGTFRSAIEDNPLCLYYKLHEPTRPTVGTIFGFRDKESAVAWADKFRPPLVVLSGKGRESKRKKLERVLPTKALCRNEIVAWWKYGCPFIVLWHDSLITWPVPKGTVQLTYFTPTEEVTTNDNC